MIKLLVDDLGRTVGACEVKHGTTGIREYGWHDDDGTFHVVGMASVTAPSACGWRSCGTYEECGLTYAFGEDLKTGGNDTFKLYEV